MSSELPFATKIQIKVTIFQHQVAMATILAQISSKVTVL